MIDVVQSTNLACLNGCSTEDKKETGSRCNTKEESTIIRLVAHELPLPFENIDGPRSYSASMHKTFLVTLHPCNHCSEQD